MSNLIKISANTETQPASAIQNQEHGPGLGFFAVGLVVNIVLIVAFIVWALKQGRNRNKQDE